MTARLALGRQCRLDREYDYASDGRYVDHDRDVVILAPAPDDPSCRAIVHTKSQLVDIVPNKYLIIGAMCTQEELLTHWHPCIRALAKKKKKQ